MSEIDTSNMTEEQKSKIEKLRLRIAQLQAKEQAILARKSHQQRADETRRAIVLGKRLEGLAEHHRGAKAMVQTLLSDLEPEFHYLFPETWPDAKRPAKGAKAKTA